MDQLGRPHVVHNIGSLSLKEAYDVLHLHFDDLVHFSLLQIIELAVNIEQGSTMVVNVDEHIIIRLYTKSLTGLIMYLSHILVDTFEMQNT